MIRHLFFNLPGSFEEVSKAVFEALDYGDYTINRSANVRQGLYSSISVSGIRMKLEMNSYDYEDTFEFMISLGSDPLSTEKVNSDAVLNKTGVVRDLLCKNLSIDVAEEESTGLKIYRAKSL